MTMTKKHYKKFAEALSQISNEQEREQIIRFLQPVFHSDNWKFDEGRFREYIKRLVNGESLKGLG